MSSAPAHSAIAASSTADSPRPLACRRLLLTGAAGHLGSVLRPRLRSLCQTLRVSDREPLADTQANAHADEEIRPAALENRAQVLALLEGVDAVVHLGGISTEKTWEAILDANIVGMVNFYDAARQHGTRRIVFASSNHVTGFYRQDEVITPRHPVRPDGFYGLSKAFGENLAQLYWDRHGIETVSLRIGSSFAEPKDRRMLATWLSFNDLERLVVAALTAPVVGHTVLYGLSDNTTRWWDNTGASHLGYRPLDSSESYRADLERRQPHIDPSDPVSRLQGGAFVRMGPFFAPESR